MCPLPSFSWKPTSTRQLTSRLLLLLLSITTISSILTLHSKGTKPGSNITRNLGKGTKWMPASIAACNGSDPEYYVYGQCSALIDCVYSKMRQVEVADAAVGATLVGLLPTILTLIGMCLCVCVVVEGRGKGEGERKGEKGKPETKGNGEMANRNFY